MSSENTCQRVYDCFSVLLNNISYSRNGVSCATTAKLLLGVVISAFGLVFVIFVMKCKFKIGFQMNMCYYLWE